MTRAMAAKDVKTTRVVFVISPTFSTTAAWNDPKAGDAFERLGTRT